MHLHDFSGILGYRRTRLLRDTYPTIEAQKSPFSSLQSFRFLRFRNYKKVSPRAAQGQRNLCRLNRPWNELEKFLLLRLFEIHALPMRNALLVPVGTPIYMDFFHFILHSFTLASRDHPVRLCWVSIRFCCCI